jgi:hypothetical protein
MKNYIVTITKALNKQSKVEVLASSKQEIIELSETQFGLGIAPFTENEIALKSGLSETEQKFHYDFIDIHEKGFWY